MRKLLLFLSLIVAMSPLNIFAAPYNPDIDTGLIRGTQQAERYLVAINNSYFYAFGNNSTQLFYKVSFDGGVTWSTDTVIHTVVGSAVMDGISVWYDRWTPGNNGVIVHIAYSIRTTSGNNSRLQYSSVNVQSGAISAAVVVTSINSNTPTSQVSITRAIGGNLYILSTDQYSGSNGFFRSIDAGAAWAARDYDVALECANNAGQTKGCSIVPSNNTSQTNDVFGCGGADSAALSCGFYDDTNNLWTVATVGSSNIRNAHSISLALDAVGTIWLTGAFENGANEDIKSFICTVNCTAPVERANILTAGAFTGTNTLTRITIYGIGGLNAAVIISGRTATSGIEVSTTSNNGAAWSAPSRYNNSNLSTQVINASVPENSQISAGTSGPLIGSIWNYSSPNGVYFFNLAVSQGIVAPTPTPVDKIWFEKMVDITTNEDSVWGHLIWMIISSAIIFVLMFIVKAPPQMYLFMIMLVGAAFLSLLYIPPEVAVMAVMIVGLVILLAILAKGSANAGGKE